VLDEPVSYLTLQRGTPVVDRFGTTVGPVERVLTLSGPFFDGLIVGTSVGSRFIDAPEVRRITAQKVDLSITCADCEAPGLTSPVGVPAARWGRTEITEEDRREVTEALKQAYVQGLLDAHELGDRFEAIYDATTFAELDRLIPQ
jgi:hypothetical protein